MGIVVFQCFEPDYKLFDSFMDFNEFRNQQSMTRQWVRIGVLKEDQGTQIVFCFGGCFPS